MRRIDEIARKHEAALLLLGRLLIAGLFLPDGLRKLAGLTGFAASLASRGVPVPGLMAPIAAIVVFVASAAILIGFRTRFASLLLIAFTIIASLVAHRFWEVADAAARQGQAVQFWKNAAILGGLFCLFVRGAGSFAVDPDTERPRLPQS
ncbi:MAG: DoxX family protein [Alphaproteobacteria bacterium]|nr:DoxX family protein [Alphaproteobacteria bacterium]